MFKKHLNRLKKRYKYAHWYLGYRVRHNFNKEQRAAFTKLAADVESFDLGPLFAVGNEGILFDGTYAPAPDTPHLLKVSLNEGKRADSFARVLDVVNQAGLPFLCEVPEFDVDADDPHYWYQVQRKIEGLMVTQYLLLSMRRRAEICNPVVLCVDLLEQTETLHGLRVIAPNVDAENVLIQPDGSLVRIDLDPYRHIENGKLPRYPLRRLFKLIHQVLIDFAPAWREDIVQGRMPCDLETFDLLFHRLHSSSIFGYDDPRKNRHKNDHLVDPRDCFTDPKEPLGMFASLRESIDMQGGFQAGSS